MGEYCVSMVMFFHESVESTRLSRYRRGAGAAKPGVTSQAWIIDVTWDDLDSQWLKQLSAVIKERVMYVARKCTE